MRVVQKKPGPEGARHIARVRLDATDTAATNRHTMR